MAAFTMSCSIWNRDFFELNYGTATEAIMSYFCRKPSCSEKEISGNRVSTVFAMKHIAIIDSLIFHTHLYYAWLILFTPYARCDCFHVLLSPIHNFFAQHQSDAIVQNTFSRILLIEKLCEQRKFLCHVAWFRYAFIFIYLFIYISFILHVVL